MVIAYRISIKIANTTMSVMSVKYSLFVMAELLWTCLFAFVFFAVAATVYFFRMAASLDNAVNYPALVCVVVYSSDFFSS